MRKVSNFNGKELCQTNNDLAKPVKPGCLKVGASKIRYLSMGPANDFV